MLKFKNSSNFPVLELTKLCLLVFTENYFEPRYQNYLKVRLASELLFKIKGMIDSYFDSEDQDLKKLVKKLNKKQSTVAYVVRYCILSLMHKKEEQINGSIDSDTQSKAESWSLELKDKKIHEKNKKLSRQWIRGEIREKDKFKLIGDKDRSLGNSSFTL